MHFRQELFVQLCVADKRSIIRYNSFLLITNRAVIIGCPDFFIIDFSPVLFPDQSEYPVLMEYPVLSESPVLPVQAVLQVQAVLPVQDRLPLQ